MGLSEEDIDRYEKIASTMAPFIDDVKAAITQNRSAITEYAKVHGLDYGEEAVIAATLACTTLGIIEQVYESENRDKNDDDAMRMTIMRIAASFDDLSRASARAIDKHTSQQDIRRAPATVGWTKKRVMN